MKKIVSVFALITVALAIATVATPTNKIQAADVRLVCCDDPPPCPPACDPPVPPSQSGIPTGRPVIRK